MSVLKFILVSWLKTINRDIHTIGNLEKFDPYEENHFTEVSKGKTYGYQEYFTNRIAPTELHTQFEKYSDWEWPEL